MNVYAYLDSRIARFVDVDVAEADPSSYFVSEGDYLAARTLLQRIEAQILRVLGFELQVSLPHPLCINHIKTLEASGGPKAMELTKRAFAYLNDALMSPQLLYLAHQPSSLSAAAVYLAAREVGVKLPGVEWWEVFDVDREELGFLVVALRSFEGFVRRESARWGDSRIPLTVEEIKAEIERHEATNGGDQVS